MPHERFIIVFSPMIFESPKSAIFTSASGPFEVSSRFSGFRSRWHTYEKNEVRDRGECAGEGKRERGEGERERGREGGREREREREKAQEKEEGHTFRACRY